MRLLSFLAVAAAGGCLNDYDGLTFASAVPNDAGAGTTSLDGAGAGGTAGGAGAAGTGGGDPPDGGAADAVEDIAVDGPIPLCPADQAACGGVCAPVTSRDECGGCDNDCSTQGNGAGFDCVQGRCRCMMRSHCGGPATDCNPEGVCVCGSATCAPGESCGNTGGAVACQCNGLASCGAGRTCCATPNGCFDLANDPSNCGGCNRRCPPGASCTSGRCV